MKYLAFFYSKNLKYMKTALTSLLFLTTSFITQAQENTLPQPAVNDSTLQLIQLRCPTYQPTLKWELGIPLIARNNSLLSNFTYQQFPNTEFLNGIFVRANYNRFGFRFFAKYNTSHIESPPCPNCPDYLSRTEDNKLFQVETGAQFSLTRRKPLLYVFTDVYYQNVFTTGMESGGIAGLYNSFSATSNGIGTHIGLGSKIRMYKSLFLSPEIGYNWLRSKTNGTSTNQITNTSSTFNYTNVNANVYGRLVLSVQF